MHDSNACAEVDTPLRPLADLQAVRHQGALVVGRYEAIRDGAIQHAPGSAVFVVRENRFGGRSRSISGAPMRVVALCLILFARTAPNRALGLKGS